MGNVRQLTPNPQPRRTAQLNKESMKLKLPKKLSIQSNDEIIDAATGEPVADAWSDSISAQQFGSKQFAGNPSAIIAAQIVHRWNCFEGMRRALKQFAECKLDESNCASFDVANRRIRAIANAALSAANEPTA